MPDDPMQPLVNIGKRLQEQAKNVGLNMVTFSVVPDPSGVEHHVHATFVKSEEPVPVEGDSEFDEIMAAQRKFELEEKAKKAREDLEKFREGFDKPGGSFLDD
jgi:hypothetical protein